MDKYFFISLSNFVPFSLLLSEVELKSNKSCSKLSNFCTTYTAPFVVLHFAYPIQCRCFNFLRFCKWDTVSHLSLEIVLLHIFFNKFFISSDFLIASFYKLISFNSHGTYSFGRFLSNPAKS